MMALGDMIALLRQECPKDDFSLKTATTPGIDGTLAIDMRVRVRLVRADNYNPRPAAKQRLDVAAHATTSVAMEAKLFTTAPLT